MTTMTDIKRLATDEGFDAMDAYMSAQIAGDKEAMAAALRQLGIAEGMYFAANPSQKS